MSWNGSVLMIFSLHVSRFDRFLKFVVVSYLHEVEGQIVAEYDAARSDEGLHRSHYMPLNHSSSILDSLCCDILILSGLVSLNALDVHGISFSIISKRHSYLPHYANPEPKRRDHYAALAIFHNLRNKLKEGKQMNASSKPTPLLPLLQTIHNSTFTSTLTHPTTAQILVPRS